MNILRYGNITKNLMRHEYGQKINLFTMVSESRQLLLVKQSQNQIKLLSTTSANYINNSDIAETSSISYSLAESKSQQLGFIGKN